jgi:hypothetical protein
MGHESSPSNSVRFVNFFDAASITITSDCIEPR